MTSVRTGSETKISRRYGLTGTSTPAMLPTAAAHGPAAHWLRVRLAGATANRDAIGATLVAVAGERKFTAEIRTAGGFQAACPAEAHFGLGAIAKLDELRIRWPDGVEQVVAGVAVDRVLVVAEEKAK